MDDNFMIRDVAAIDDAIKSLKNTGLMLKII